MTSRRSSFRQGSRLSDSTKKAEMDDVLGRRLRAAAPPLSAVAAVMGLDGCTTAIKCEPLGALESFVLGGYYE